jgi:hypothetical protein
MYVRAALDVELSHSPLTTGASHRRPKRRIVDEADNALEEGLPVGG